MSKSKQIVLAGCVIQNSEGKILLLHRNTEKRTQWELPGGKVEENETTEHAASREVTEELGIRVTLVTKLGSACFQEDSHIMEYVWYLAQIKSGAPQLLEEKFDAIQYFSFTELEKLSSISSNVQNLLKAFRINQIILE